MLDGYAKVTSPFLQRATCSHLGAMICRHQARQQVELIPVRSTLDLQQHRKLLKGRSKGAEYRDLQQERLGMT